MSCTLEGTKLDINGIHKNHYCHLCANRNNLGALFPENNNCAECIKGNICNFKKEC